MTIDSAIKEWKSKKRIMGCVAAANWWIKRFPHWKKLRKRFYYPNGNDSNGKFWEHEVVTDGNIEIDISPYANRGTLDK